MHDAPATRHLGTPLLPSPEQDPEIGILRTPKSAGGWLDAARGLQATILSLADYILLTISAASFLFLVVRWFWRDATFDEVVCGYEDVVAGVLALLLLHGYRELRLRKTIEASAKQMEVENAKLHESNAELSGNLELLQRTVGAIGTQGSQWFDQLRELTSALSVQSDRQTHLLRGQVRMWLLSNVDINHDMLIDAGELKSLKFAHPEVQTADLEAAAGAKGIPVQLLEPRLMEVFDSSGGPNVSPENRSFRTPPRPTRAAGNANGETVPGRLTF